MICDPLLTHLCWCLASANQFFKILLLKVNQLFQKIGFFFSPFPQSNPTQVIIYDFFEKLVFQEKHTEAQCFGL